MRKKSIVVGKLSEFFTGKAVTEVLRTPAWAVAESYARSAKNVWLESDETQNIGCARFKTENRLLGYDTAEFVRNWQKVNNLEHLSLCEIAIRRALRNSTPLRSCC